MISLSLEIRGIPELKAALRRVDGAKMRRLAVQRAAALMSRNWKQELSGPGGPERLGVRTGFLRRSVLTDSRGDMAIVGTAAKYAAIHEYGGTIRPVRGPYLTFQVRPNQWVRVQQVVMPKRPHFNPAFKKTEDAMPKILATIAKEVGLA